MWSPFGQKASKQKRLKAELKGRMIASIKAHKDLHAEFNEVILAEGYRLIDRGVGGPRPFSLHKKINGRIGTVGKRRGEDTRH